MGALFRVFRVTNLAIIVFTQIMALSFLRSDFPTTSLFNLQLLMFLLATLLTGAAGYIINDYFDVKIDAINKPSKLVVGSTINLRSAILIHLAFNFAGVLLAFMINWKLGLLFLLIAFMLWQYSASFKRTFLVGNVVIALLMGLTLFSVYLYDNLLNLHWVVFYAFYAFLTGLIREIIKDVEDMEGDQAFGCKTLPLVKGFRVTRNVLKGLTIALMLLLLSSIAAFTLQSMMIISLYFVICLVIPLSYFYRILSNADKKQDFKLLSRYIKVLMLSGVLSMAILLTEVI